LILSVDGLASHVDLAGDSGGDEGGAVLAEHVDPSSYTTGKMIESARLLIKVSDDLQLFRTRRHSKGHPLEVPDINARDGRTKLVVPELIETVAGLECIAQPLCINGFSRCDASRVARQVHTIEFRRNYFDVAEATPNGVRKLSRSDSRAWVLICDFLGRSREKMKLEAIGRYITGSDVWNTGIEPWARQ
jgi:hypothetical protein